MFSQPASIVGSPSADPATDTTSVPLAPAPDEPMVMGKCLLYSIPRTYDDIVYYSVGGEPMPFSLVTQEIADEKMSPEEYTAWYEVMMAQ